MSGVEVSRADQPDAVRGAGKSANAFRTTGEVAEELDLPAYVLRFWESKFPQVKPLKRRGGRRYYRPQDVDLLRRIRECLYQEGYTIRGAQKLLRDRGLVGCEPAPPPIGGVTTSNLPALHSTAHSTDRADSPALPPQGIRKALEEVRRELREVRVLLRRLIAP